MKTCNRCLKQKHLTSFFKDKNASDGLYSICKDCKTEATLKWREQNKEKYNKGMREYRANNKEVFRSSHLRLNYGITTEQYNQMLKDQNNTCAICEKPPKGKRPLAVDHNHKTGQVRGLLCYGCNRYMAVVDDLNLLAKALAYAKKYE